MEAHPFTETKIFQETTSLCVTEAKIKMNYSQRLNMDDEMEILDAGEDELLNGL